MSNDTVKSVRRVFEILELFDRERRPMSAKAVSKSLGYPLTSTHALLKSMQTLGYADYDAANWCYVPSPVLSALLDWVRDFLVRETQILNLTTALNAETQETINLSRRINLNVRIIHGLESRHNVGVSVRVGTMMPLTGSLTGVVALAAMEEDARQQVLSEIATRDQAQQESFRPELLASVIDELKDHGSVMRCDVTVPGIGAVCTPILTEARNEMLVLGVVGPSDRIQRGHDEYRAALHRGLQTHNVATVFNIR